MQSISADIILLPETNIQWNDYSVATVTSRHRRDTFSFSKQISSNSIQIYDSTYQPGGTCSILVDKMVGRHHSSFSDPTLGRWTVTNLNMRRDQQLSIICCYQVCNQSISTVGPKTAFAQQWSLLRERGIHHPNPRKQFYSDLDELIASLRRQGNMIILAGDFNSTLGDDPTGLDRILHKYNLADTIQHLHGSYHCATHIRGSKCIDYIFCSSEFLPAVQRGAILPFQSITFSDHRPIFLDLDITTTFQTPLSSLLKPHQRLLSSTHLSNCNKYIARLHSSFHRHRVFDRIKQIEQATSCDDASIQLVEALDRDVTRLMIASEKRLQRPSVTPFSSALAQECIRVAILKLRYKELKYNRSYATQITRLSNKLSKSFPLPTNITSCNMILRNTRTTVHTLRKNAIALREKFLISKEILSDHSKIISRIRQSKELKRSYQKLCFLLRPPTTTMVTQLDVPTDDTPPKKAVSWTTLTDPDTITQRLVQRNTKHFGAAYGTPFTIPPLSHDFDWTATSPRHQDVLNGSHPPYPDPLLNRLLQRLKQRVSPIQPQLTMPELIRRLRRWKESTSTSPSRRHLGHYKALLPLSGYNLQEYLQSPEGQILSVYLSILNFCARTGYSLIRWQKIVTMMIPKENNNFKLHRLRVIHLYEADLTALFSIWSRKMIMKSTAHNSLNPGSYGARPGRSSIDPAFISLMQQELSTITRTNLVLAPNDAAQCYDRIVPNHAMLTCMSHGMAPTAATCIGSTLKHAKYYLKTALNESTTFWSNTSTTPIYGTGQGSGISPGICCVTFSDLFDVYDDTAQGSTYITPTTSEKITIYNVGFVDDTTTSVCDHHLSQPLPISTLVELLQNGLHTWSKLLHMSGGALELSKTEVFPMFWKFNASGAPYLASPDHISISLTSPHTHHTHTIQASSPYSTYKLLGFHLSPSLSMSKQYHVLLTKAHKIANAIAGSSVNRREAYLSYFAIYLPSITYFLVLTSLTSKQCHHIQSKPTMIFLQKCGYSAMMHRAIVYGPRSSGGLGFRDLSTLQGIAHTLKIIQTLRTPGQPQSLLCLMLTEWQIHSGSSIPLLQHPRASCMHLEGSWLRSTRTFLSTIDGSITIEGLYCPTTTHTHDVALMDAFQRITGLGRKRLMQLNYCRIYLRIHFLSELVNSAGTHLIPGFWTGTDSTRPYPSLHRYPRQAIPSPSIWSFWRSSIRKLFCHPHSLQLRCPLVLNTPHRSSDKTSPPISSALPIWQQSLLHHVSFLIPSQNFVSNFANHLATHSILAASDGSSTTTNATFGWTLRVSNNDIVTNFGPVHGHQSTAFRAEATGLLSLLLFLHSHLSRQHWITPSPNQYLPVYLDNSSLLRIVTRMSSESYLSPSDAISSEYDLILQIADLLTTLPLSLQFHHVKSHQDKHAPISSLSLPAQANCHADHLATSAQLQCQSQDQSPLYPAAQCRLCLSAKTITRNHQHYLHSHSSATRLRQYITSSHSWTNSNHIDWDCFQAICLKQTFRHPFFIKWVHRLLPVGVVMHRRNVHSSPFCPVCDQRETALHFITCTHISRLPLKQHFLTTLRKCLTSIPTDPTLKLIFLEGVNSVLTGFPPHFPSSTSPYSSFVSSQSAIGWDNLLRGFLSVDWIFAHRLYLQTSNSDSTSTLPNPFLPALLVIITEVHNMWKFRSSQRHQKDARLHDSELLRQAHLQLRDLYRLQSHVLPTDRTIFKPTLQDHVQENLSSITAWIQNHSSYLRHSCTLATTLRVSHTAPLTHYFPTL